MSIVFLPLVKSRLDGNITTMSENEYYVRIMAALESAGLTAAQAAVKAGVSTYFFQNLKRKPDQSPSVANLRKVAQALGVSFLWLSTGQGDPDEEIRSDSGEDHIDMKLLALVLESHFEVISEDNIKSGDVSYETQAQELAKLYKQMVANPNSTLRDDATRKEIIQLNLREL